MCLYRAALPLERLGLIGLHALMVTSCWKSCALV